MQPVQHNFLQGAKRIRGLGGTVRKQKEEGTFLKQQTAEFIRDEFTELMSQFISPPPQNITMHSFYSTCLTFLLINLKPQWNAVRTNNLPIKLTFN